MKRLCKVISAILISSILSISICKQLRAEVEIKDLSTVFDKATIDGEVDLYYRYDKNPWFGKNLSDINPEFDQSPDNDYGEIYTVLRFGLTKDTPFANVTAKVGAFFAQTIGQDIYPVYEDASDMDLDQAWIKFGMIGKSPFDLTIGRQNIFIEKKFVIGTSFQNQKDGSALWFAQPDSFGFAVRADGDFGPLKGTWVWAHTSGYIGMNGAESGPSLYGMNLHYDINETAYVYGGVYYKEEEDLINGGAGNQNMPISYDFGADASFGGLHLEGEFVLQRGNSGPTGDDDLDAYAYFVGATYTFNDVKFTPFLETRYVFYSGDDPNTKDNEQYDYMFGNTEWLPAQLVGEAHLFMNTNKKDLRFAVGFCPIEAIKMRAEYRIHYLDEEETSIYGPLTSDDWAKEVDLYIDWGLSDNLFLGILLGKVMPGDAAEEVFGNEDAYQAWCFLNFTF
ncbi:MAG: alginate export family protein [Pseudomonadota bacterium]